MKNKSDTTSFNFDAIASSPDINNRMLLTMRLLGHLEFMLGSQIKQLVYRSISRQGMDKEVNKLIRQDFVWSVTAPFAAIAVRKARGHYDVPFRPPNMYGLTNTGLAYLSAVNAVPDKRIFEGLKARDPRGRPPSILNMPHDLQVSWYCSNILESARRSRYVRSVYVLLEYVPHSRQRVDALIVLRMSRTPLLDRDTEKIPLFTGAACGPNEYDIILGLEVDRNTEDLRTLVGKGETYRDLTVNGTYMAALGGLMMPVFLVPSSRRAAQIARGWRAIWPNGWGLISSPVKSDDMVLGVLWGTYLNMTTTKLMSPLNHITTSPDAVAFEQIVTREQWMADQIETGILLPEEPQLEVPEPDVTAN